MSVRLLEAAFTTPELQEAAGDRAWLEGMLAFERALAIALARAGVVPDDVARIIADACQPARFDLDAIARAVTDGGNPALPLVRQLTALVPEPARAFVHRGATSQDVVDTATMLVARRALALLVQELRVVEANCSDMARGHQDTLMVGRTLLQQAAPITFGLKAASWYGQVVRARHGVEEVERSCLVLQFGGAVGTLAALGDRGLEVSRHLAAELGLGEPEMPWHAARDRLVRVQAALGLAAGAMGRVATDIVLMAQTEVGEFAEPAPGVSSTLPHKQNPVRATLAVAAARRVTELMSSAFGGLIQQHERSAGAWHAEWETFFDILRLTVAAVRHVRCATDRPNVHVERMAQNLAHTRGVIMAEAAAALLSEHVGRDVAHQVLTDACARALATGAPLADVLKGEVRVHGAVTGERIDEALAPRNHLGVTRAFITRALTAAPGSDHDHD